MRLGQIARNISLSPSEVVSFLATHNIPIDENPNSRLEPAHVRMILEKFAPDQLIVAAPSPVVEVTPVVPVILGPPIPEASDAQPVPEPLIDITEEVNAPVPESLSESQEPTVAITEVPDVIKAPKVALSGLKVLGKIDLPEPKKKDQEAAAESSAPVRDEQPRRNYQSRNQGREQRPYKNPIALQREREQKEELEKRKEKAEKEKDRRTQNYLKKVKMSPPTKAVRMVDEPLEQMTKEDLKEEPKGWFSKLIRWLNS